MSHGVRKLPIGGLSPDINNALIIAVIIAKQNLRIFISKKDSEERGVWNLTVRDSIWDTINCTIWGSAEFIRTTHEMFNIGDVVAILRPRILFKQPGDLDSTFQPVVSSPFQLQLQENMSEMLLYSEDDVDDVKQLMNTPTKPPGDFLRLSDVSGYGQAMTGQYVNLLVAVRKVGEIRYVKSRRDSKDLICRHITVMDQSNLEFHITLWSEEIIKRSDQWRSRKTVIFFADIRVDWDNFRNTVTATITSRTVVTENPNTNEADILKNYAKTAPIQPTDVLDHFANNIVDVSSVNTVMTTAQVLDRAYNRTSSEEQFTALIFAMVTHLDLDGSDTVVAYNCSNCSQLLDETGSCLNRDCLISLRPEYSSAKASFNLRLNVTDHRGTLQNCRLVSPTADTILGCTPSEYMKMTTTEKTNLKWSLLLTRCEVRILVLSTSPERPRPLFSILSCCEANSAKVAAKLPIY